MTSARRPVVGALLATAIGAAVVASCWLRRGDPHDGVAAIASPASIGDRAAPVIPAPSSPEESPPGAAAPAPAPAPSPPFDDRAPSRGAAGSAAIDHALAMLSPEPLALYASLRRAGVQMPPALVELLERQHQGASPGELRAFVREHFPADAHLRLIVLGWLDLQDPGRVDPAIVVPGGRDRPAPRLGTIVRADRSAR